MKQDKNFTIRLKATIERKLKEVGIKKHGIWPPDEFGKPEGEKEKWWKFIESLNDVKLEDLQGESLPGKEEGWIEVTDWEKFRQFDGLATFLIHVDNSATKTQYWDIVAGYIAEDGDLNNQIDDEYAGWSYQDVSYYRPLTNLPSLPQPPKS